MTLWQSPRVSYYPGSPVNSSRTLFGSVGATRELKRAALYINNFKSFPQTERRAPRGHRRRTDGDRRRRGREGKAAADRIVLPLGLLALVALVGVEAEREEAVRLQLGLNRQRYL